MFATNKPDQPDAYGHYPSRMIGKTTNAWYHDPATQGSWFQDLLYQIHEGSVRISNMYGGERAVLLLLLVLKLDMLSNGSQQHRKETWV